MTWNWKLHIAENGTAVYTFILKTFFLEYIFLNRNRRNNFFFSQKLKLLKQFYFMKNRKSGLKKQCRTNQGPVRVGSIFAIQLKSNTFNSYRSWSHVKIDYKLD